MTKRIFHSILWVSSIVFLIGMALMTAVLYQNFGEQLKKELKKEAYYISEAISMEGPEYLASISGQGERITLIDENGKVLYDNKADAEGMENHREREEMKEALQNGQGAAVRRSDTLSRKMVYYALRLSDGTVLRVSSTQYTLAALLGTLLPPVLLILAVMTVASALVANKAAKRIVAPLNQLDLEHPVQNETYEEMTPLLKKLARQQKTIERQIAEAKRQQQEFSVITDNMKEGLLVIDRRSEILASNESAVRLFQMEKAAEEKSILSWDRSEKFQRITKETLKGGHQDAVLELHGRFIRIIANPVKNRDQVEGAVLLFVDVTEKIKREELRREFTANVSHELKTPLTSISGYAELLENGLVKEEDIAVFAGRIFKETQRLISLVNDIMEISQLDEGSLPYEKEKVKLKELSAEILERLEPKAKERGIGLSVEGEETILFTVRKILDEILYNLCDNAIKYNKNGGQVTVTTGERDGKIFLSVRDTGIGILQEHQKRIFERFYRVDKSHSKAIGGTGLGLSIVKHGAACLEAELALKSEEGVGSEFLLTWEACPLE